MTSLINPTPTDGDYTVTMRVGTVYDKITGLLAPYRDFGIKTEGYMNTYYLSWVTWDIPDPLGNPSSPRILHLVNGFPETHDPRHRVQGSEPFNGLSLVASGYGRDRKISFVGMPLEVWAGCVLEIRTHCYQRPGGREVWHTDKRNLVFLPEDPQDSSAHGISELSVPYGMPMVSLAHGHSRLESGLGKAHADNEALAARVTALETPAPAASSRRGSGS